MTRARPSHRAAALVGLVLAALAVLSTPSCSVNRRSTAFACENDEDCDSGRACTRGFCAERGPPPPTSTGCPAGCTSCDLSDRTCDIECSAGKNCDVVVCPVGFDCTILCMSPSSCSNIDCSGGASCDITCLGGLACPNIECGPGPCDVSCVGIAACGFLECSESCRCDQDCGPGACTASDCPMVQDRFCTEEGSIVAPCDSTDSRGCDRCP